VRPAGVSPRYSFERLWYDKEFDRRNPRSRAAQEDVRPLIAGKADTMPANSRLSFVTVFHHPIGTPSSVRAKALILVGKSTVCRGSDRRPSGPHPWADSGGNIKMIEPASAGSRLGADLHPGQGWQSGGALPCAEPPPTAQSGPGRSAPWHLALISVPVCQDTGDLAHADGIRAA
jgi:hypothetical protein